MYLTGLRLWKRGQTLLQIELLPHNVGYFKHYSLLNHIQTINMGPEFRALPPTSAVNGLFTIVLSAALFLLRSEMAESERLFPHWCWETLTFLASHQRTTCFISQILWKSPDLITQHEVIQCFVVCWGRLHSKAHFFQYKRPDWDLLKQYYLKEISLSCMCKHLDHSLTPDMEQHIFHR